MKREEIIKKVKETLPDFNWEDNRHLNNNIRTNIACAEITVGESYFSDEDVISIPEFVKDRVLSYLEKANYSKSDVSELNSKFNDGSILLSDLDEKTLDLVINGLKLWKEEIDRLRTSKGNIEEDQLIIIHPDWDLGNFEKDFKFISSDSDYGHRLGIMSTKEWDFSNEELCQELNENSGDCFGIGEEEFSEDDEDEEENEKEVHYPDVVIDCGLEDAYDELKTLYPQIDKITKIYSTDFD